MAHLHLVFHISLLEPFQANPILGCHVLPPPLVKIDSHQEYEVTNICDSKKSHGQLYYLMEWSGDHVDKQTWEQAKNVTNCQDLLQGFHSTYPDKPGPD